MKSLLTLLCTVLNEVGVYCSVDTTLDVKTVQRRFEGEGLRFLTVDLPRYAQGVERSLASERCTPDLFTGFGFSGKLPKLFGGFMELIFNRASGMILSVPNPEAIRSLRQVCLLLKKIEIPCSDEKEQAAFDRYIESDKELEVWRQQVDPALLRRFYLMGQLLFSDIFLRSNREIRDMEICPKHGKGSTADRLLGNEKFNQVVWTERCEAVFPYWRYATTRGYSQDNYDHVEFLSARDEIPARVISVPKTQETPRIIAMEPTSMQYMQQGIMSSLSAGVAKDSFLRNMISTLDQEPNQLLAQSGSITGLLATLDLSEASDRVSNILVEELTRSFPHLYDAVQATRSTKADVKGHGVHTLNRFASMGSALCFPFETFVFLTVVMMGIEDANHIHFSNKRDLISYIGRVRVYGDDIVVPTNTTDSVVHLLESFGFKVNAHKSFWTGLFRESCGKEYFNGHDVTLARVRQMLPSSRNDVTEIVALVSLRNHMYLRGLWTTVRWLDELIESFIPFPAVSERSSALGKTSFLGHEVQRQCPKLQRPMVKAAVVRYSPRKSPLDGDAALMKCLLSKSSDFESYWFGDIRPLPEADHLRFAGRPVAASINNRWTYSD